MTRLASAVGLLALVLPAPVSAAGPYDDLLKHTPAGANTLALIDVKAAFASPLAKKEKWKEQGQPGHRSALGFVPDDAERLVIASEVNLNTLTRNYQIGIVKVSEVPVMRNLAAREGGTVDQFGDLFAVISPRDVYFSSLSATELVAVYPADRQFTARWLKAIKAKKTGELSPYLRKVADAAGENTVTIALDLEDAVDKYILKLTLPSSPSVAKVKTIDVAALATFLANTKGMTFSAKVGESITASITMDFVFPTTRYRQVLPDLLRELIEGQGIALPGFETWEAKFTETTMTLSGSLTTADLKRVISLFAFPNPAEEPDPAGKPGEPSAAMTKRYLSAVQTILADIKHVKDSPNYEKTATWHEKAAAQIEQLSKQGVDPAASDAAYQAAKRLRAIGASLRGVPIDVNALESKAYYSSRPSLGMMPGGPWGWRPFIYGPNQVDTNIPQIREEMAKVIADDQKKRVDAWSAIDRVMNETRRALTEKYKTPF